MSKKAIQISGEIATETTKAIITSGAGLILAAFFPETIPYWGTTLCIPSKVGFSVFCERIKDKFNVKEGYFASVNEIYNKKVEDVLKKGTIGDECFVPEYEHFRRYYFLCNEHENEISENNFDENGVINYLSPQTIKEILKLDTKNTNQDTVIKVADEILKNVITEITDNTDLAPTYWAMRNCKDINAFEKILNDINKLYRQNQNGEKTKMTKLCLNRTGAILSVISIVLSLAGCGTNSTPTTTDDETLISIQKTATTVVSTSNTLKTESTVSSTNSTTEGVITESSTLSQETTAPTEPPVETTEPPTTVPPEEPKDEYGLTEQQRNSFSMLYYLAITAEDIRISKDNRLMLDEIYTSLLNDINPGTIDETTQDHLKNLRDIIKSYINISVKRDRLQYIYNQNKAETIRSAVPDPIAILSTTKSFDWKNLVLNVAFTAVDSYNNYKSANVAADTEFLMSGWELDDEEIATIQKNRERAFDYMVDIVQEYGLDGKLTLNEKAIETFAEICEIDSVQQKIRRLESEEETYKLLGNYWLELASCYFETSQYKKCLDCVDNYNDLATGIYRMDYNYVRILPMAIVAAQETYSGQKYISVISTFADAILENTTAEEWSTRYFAAQVYLDLYARTDDRQYLETAYNIVYDNVTILLDEQLALNSAYLNDVVEVTIDEPDYRFMTEDEKKKAKKEYKAERKKLKEYNKGLKENRKNELPPLYEPLILNCDLLFALAEEININSKEKAEIEAILQTENNGVFLSKPVNDRYSFSAVATDYNIDFTKSEIRVPADLLSINSVIIVEVVDGSKTTIFDDCIVAEVERDGDSIDNYIAIVTSDKMKDYNWTADSEVTVEIYNGSDYDAVTFKFEVIEYKDNLIIPNKVVFGTV